MKTEKTYRINGFDQIKAFYSWVFNNQDKEIGTAHISLYNFLVNQNNRSNWVEWFKVPYDLGMAGSCIGSRNTYYKCLDDLQKWKLIEYRKGINNFKAPLIKLCLLNNEHLYENVPVPLSEHVSEQVTMPLTEPLTEHIYKLLTNNLKRITDNLPAVLNFIDSLYPNENIKADEEMFEVFRIAYPGSKRGLETEFENFRRKHKNWKSILPILSAKLSNQINKRESIEENGGWVPDWKNLQTWINGKCWGEEIAPGKKNTIRRKGNPYSIGNDVKLSTDLGTLN